MSSYVLVTGGLGYIGSHIVVELLSFDYNVIIIDDLSNSSIDIYHNILSFVNNDKEISELVVHKKQRTQISTSRVELYTTNLSDATILNRIFDNYIISHVIHLAAFKSVNESISNPLDYYENNVSNTIQLLQIMKSHFVYNFIYSSSATVYGNNTNFPIKETDLTGVNITCPYGRSKFIVEEILKDLQNEFNMICFRYFNPIGNHSSNLFGDNPPSVPSNIMPYLSRVAHRVYPSFNIFGSDYPTKDGTCERDYIHVVDVAKAHVLGLNRLKNGLQIFNLGTGMPTSILALIQTYERVNNVHIPVEYKPRRTGDICVSYCDTSLANSVLGWIPSETLETMCLSSHQYNKSLCRKNEI
jgi:UDP-glucose 4-epimerase